MNFLNKKYTSMHSPSPYNSASRTFLPSSTTLRESPQSLHANNCESHPSELVRHMCLQCVELLCSQCIEEHLQLHRTANIIPKIVSIRQLRHDMEAKIETILGHMGGHSAKHSIDLDGLRKHVNQKIQNMRKELIRAVDQWVSILKKNLVESLGLEEVAKTKTEMERLREQVSMLQQSLSTSGQPMVVKKIFQIDIEKLNQGYDSMGAKFREVQQKANFDVVVNWKDIIKGFEANVAFRNRDQAIQQQGQLQQQSRQESRRPSRKLSSHSLGNKQEKAREREEEQV